MLKNFHYIFEVLLTANGQVHMFILACQSEKEMWDWAAKIDSAKTMSLAEHQFDANGVVKSPFLLKAKDGEGEGEVKASDAGNGASAQNGEVVKSIDFEGYLFKESKRTGHWKKRYFVLCGKQLLYYMDDEFALLCGGKFSREKCASVSPNVRLLTSLARFPRTTLPRIPAQGRDRVEAVRRAARDQGREREQVLGVLAQSRA